MSRATEIIVMFTFKLFHELLMENEPMGYMAYWNYLFRVLIISGIMDTRAFGILFSQKI